MSVAAGDEGAGGGTDVPGAELAPVIPMSVPPTVNNLWNWAKGYIRRFEWTLAPIWLTALGSVAGDEKCACPDGALCAAPGKHLVSGMGVARDEADVEMIWAAGDLRVSEGLIGIAAMCGAESNLLVMDIREGGAEITRARYKIVEEVLTAETPSGGQHWFFQLDEDEQVTGGRREVELVTGVWLLGDDAYVALGPRPGYSWVGGAGVLRSRAPGEIPAMLRHRLVANGLLSTIGGGIGRGGSAHRDDPWRTMPGVPLAGGGVMPRTYTRSGDIRRVIDEWGHMITWTPGFGFRVWTEAGWAGSERSHAVLQARVADLVGIHMREAEEAHARGSDDLAKEALKWSSKSLSRSTQSVLSDLVTDERVLVPRADMWDSEGWIVGLPVRDGVGRVVDLRTLAVTSDARHRRVSRKLGVEWGGEAEGRNSFNESTWFKKYIRDLAEQHGSEWVRLLQRAMGASLYGRNGVEGDLDAVFCLKGPARSGKSTAQVVLSTVMGGYAGPGNENLLFGDRGNPEFVIAGVLGKRALFFDEPPLHSALNTTRLKALSGGDAFTGRPPYGREEITFEPEVSLWLMTNHALEISDDAVWRRMKIFQFEKSLAEKGKHAADPRLRKALAEDPKEKSAELWWVLCGARDWFNDGWGDTSVWTESVDEEKAAHDPIARWMIEGIKVTGVPTDTTTLNDAIYAFTQWLIFSGSEKPKLTASALRDELNYKLKNIAPSYDKATMTFVGIVTVE